MAIEEGKQVVKMARISCRRPSPDG